eukprot:1127108-Prymnesium_polylepis.1
MAAGAFASGMAAASSSSQWAPSSQRPASSQPPSARVALDSEARRAVHGLLKQVDSTSPPPHTQNHPPSP